MTEARASAWIVTSLAVSGTLAAVKDVSTDGQLDGLRLGVGLTVAGVMLATLAQVAPDVAGALALLVMVTSVFVFGGPAWVAINRALKG